MILSEETLVAEETKQPMFAVILAPQPPPHAISQPDLLAAKHVGAVSVVVVVGPAAGDAIHPSDRLGTTAVFRPVIEFLTEAQPRRRPAGARRYIEKWRSCFARPRAARR